MGNMIKDADGKVCNAKIIYNISILSMLVTICYKVITSPDADYTALGVLFGSVAATTGSVYYGRNDTKAKANVQNN